MDYLKGSAPIEQLLGTYQPSEGEDQNDSIFGDIGTGLKQGVTTDLAHTVTGLVDLAGSAVGADVSATAAADKAGLADLEKSYYNELTPETKEALRKVEEAEGFWGTLGAYASNPRAIAYDVARALPMSLAGGGLGAAGAKGAAKLAGTATAKNAVKKELLGSTSAKAANYWAAGGEGLVGAGMSASSIAQYNAANPETRDPLEGVGYAALTGLGTGLVAGAAGRIGGSVESAVFNKSIRETMANKPWASVGKSAVTEGLEEAAQAPTETVPQNWAEDKPWNEGLGQNIAQSMIAGSAMGGGAHGAMRALRFASPGDGRPQVSQEPVDVNQAASGATMSMEGATPVEGVIQQGDQVVPTQIVASAKAAPTQMVPVGETSPATLDAEEVASQQRRAEILAQRQAEMQAAEEAKAAKEAEKLAAKQSRENERLAKAEQKRQVKAEIAQRKADEKKAKEDEFQQARARYLDIFGVPEDQRERYKKPVALDAVRKHYDKEGYAPAAKALREANEALGSRDFDNVNKLVPALNGISENATTSAEFADRFDGLAKQYAKSNPKKAEVYTLAAQAMRSPDKSMADVFDAHQRKQAFDRFEAANQAAPKNLPTYDLYDVQAGNLKPGKAQLKFTLRDQEITFQGQVKGKQFFPDTKQLNDYADYIEGKRERHPEFYDSIMQAINPADQASGAVAKGTDPEAEISENALASGEPTAVSELVQSKADSTEEPDKQLEAAGIHVTSDIGGSKTTDEHKDANNFIGRLMYTRLLTKASNRGADGKRIVELDTKHKTFLDGSLAQLEEGVKNNPALAKEFQDAITSQEALDAVSRLEKWKPQRAANAALELLVWLDKASRAANFDPKKADRLSEKLFNLVARGQAEEAGSVETSPLRYIDTTAIPFIGKRIGQGISNKGQADISIGKSLFGEGRKPVYSVDFNAIRKIQAKTAVGKELQKVGFFVVENDFNGLAIPFKSILEKSSNPAEDLKGLFTDTFIKHVLPAIENVRRNGFPFNEDVYLVDGTNSVVQLRKDDGSAAPIGRNGGSFLTVAKSHRVVRIPLDGKAIPVAWKAPAGTQMLRCNFLSNGTEGWRDYVPYHECGHMVSSIVGRDKTRAFIEKYQAEIENWVSKILVLTPNSVPKYAHGAQNLNEDLADLAYILLYPANEASDTKKAAIKNGANSQAADEAYDDTYCEEMFASLFGARRSNKLFIHLLANPNYAGLADIVRELDHVVATVSNNSGSQQNNPRPISGNGIRPTRGTWYARGAGEGGRTDSRLGEEESGQTVGTSSGQTDGSGEGRAAGEGESRQGEIDDNLGSIVSDNGRGTRDHTQAGGGSGDSGQGLSDVARTAQVPRREDRSVEESPSGRAVGAGQTDAGRSEAPTPTGSRSSQGEVDHVGSTLPNRGRSGQDNRGQLSRSGDIPRQEPAESGDDEGRHQTDKGLAREEPGQAVGTSSGQTDGSGEGRAAGEGESRQGEIDDNLGSIVSDNGRGTRDHTQAGGGSGDSGQGLSDVARTAQVPRREDRSVEESPSGRAVGAGQTDAGRSEAPTPTGSRSSQGEVDHVGSTLPNRGRSGQDNRGQLSRSGDIPRQEPAESGDDEGRHQTDKGLAREEPGQAVGTSSGQTDGSGEGQAIGSGEGRQGQGLTQRTQKAIDAAIDKVFKRSPKWKARAKNVNHFLFRTALGGYFTRDVIKMAYDATGIDGFRHWGNVHEKINTLRNELLKDASAISNKAANLPKEQRDVVNEYIKDAVVQGAWGYWHKGVFKDEAAYNEYRDGLEDQAKYDAEIAMRRRWVKLNKAQREVISDVFEYGNKQLRERYRLLKEKLDEQRMPALEEQDGEIPENAQLEELRKEVDRLSKSSYVPLMRAGSHMVIFKSADYVAAEKELKAQEDVFNSLEKPTKEDRKRVQKAASTLNALKSSGDDYAVEFVDGYGTAEQIAKEYESEYPGSKVVFGERLEELKDNVPGYKQLERAANMLAKSMEEGELADKYGAHAKSLAKELHAMISKMYIESLAETSAKKRMLKKRTVRGFNQNMIENLMAAAPSTANMLAFMRYSDEVAKAGREIDESIKKLQGDDFATARVFQSELIQRENLSTQQTSDAVNGVLRTASMMMLLTNPAYYLQNMTQSIMMSAPFMAQRHGAQIFKRLVSNTMEVAKWMKDDPTLEKLEKQMLDESVKNKPLTMDEWKALDHSRRHGHLDIGMTQDFGDVNRGGGKVRDAAVRVSDKLNKMARQVEMLNRVSTFLTAYRAEIMRGQSPAKAREYADDVIYQTHGDYSAFNAPKWFTYNGLTRVMTQFRKFQLIQAGLMTRLAANSFKGATPEVRAEARRQFAYMLATHMAFTGLKGTPFATVLLGIAAMGMGDTGDDGEDLIRKMIGDKDMSNLLMRGVPAWLGMDVSGKIGAENMLSPMPYMNAKFSDGRDGANELIAGALGPAASLVQKFYTAGQYFVQGDEWKALEYALPNGLATNLSKGVRFMTEGYSSKAGDVLVKPQDYDVGDFLIQTLGFQPRVMTDRMRVQDSLIRHKESFDADKNRIYMDFKKARREGDHAGMNQARREMLKLAAEARKQGLTGYTIQNMINAANDQRRRERQAVGGVGTNKNDRQFVKKMSEI
jgi:hypothetical protein